jgi:hypothetical protein
VGSKDNAGKAALHHVSQAHTLSSDGAEEVIKTLIAAWEK